MDSAVHNHYRSGVTLSDEARFQLQRGERLLRERDVRRRELRAVAAEIAAMLGAEFSAGRVWVFGSVVRPWFHEDSDLDLAVEGVPIEQRADAWDRALALALAVEVESVRQRHPAAVPREALALIAVDLHSYYTRRRWASAAGRHPRGPQARLLPQRSRAQSNVVEVDFGA